MSRIITAAVLLSLAACPGPTPDPTPPGDPCFPPECLSDDRPVSPLRGDLEPGDEAYWTPYDSCPNWDGQTKIQTTHAMTGRGSLVVAETRCFVESHPLEVPPNATTYVVTVSTLRLDDACTSPSCGRLVMRFFGEDRLQMFSREYAVGPSETGVWQTTTEDGPFPIDGSVRYISVALSGLGGTLTTVPIYFDAVGVTIQ